MVLNLVRKYLFFILICCFGLSANSQTIRDAVGLDRSFPLTPVETVVPGSPDTIRLTGEHKFTHMELRDGLSSQHVRMLWFDNRDYLWVATSGGGVSIYDGEKFSYLSTLNGLTHDIVWDFEQDDEGKVWIGTDNGISIYDGSKIETLNVEDGIGNQHIWSLFRDSKNRMWIGTAGGGISVYEEGQLTSNSITML